MLSFIDTREAARRLNITIRRVQALIAAGRLPAEKIGNSYAIREADLALLNSRKNGRPKPSPQRTQEEWNRILKKYIGCIKGWPTGSIDQSEIYGRLRPMNSRIIIDADAIIATFNERDQWHAAASSRFAELPKPFYTCESVISEACFRAGGRRTEVVGLIKDGILEIKFSLSEEIEAVSSLMKKYANVPVSLADACLVRLSELLSDSVVFTFDQDFLIYRRNVRQSIPTVGRS